MTSWSTESSRAIAGTFSSTGRNRAPAGRDSWLRAHCRLLAAFRPKALERIVKAGWRSGGGDDNRARAQPPSVPVSLCHRPAPLSPPIVMQTIFSGRLDVVA
jgi:hypothetical protein